MTPMNRRAGSLDAHLDKRRKELGLRWSDVADRAGVNAETIRLMRKGGERKRASSTDNRVEDALGWTRGSIARIREGGEPEIADPTARISYQYASTEPITNATHIDEELARWINDALRYGVTPDELREWDLNDPLERELFVHRIFPWPAKVRMRDSTRRAIANELKRRQREAANHT